ncbi:MAG TPA: CoA pyrophosphatase [Flavobacteriales bacterium]
MIDASLPALQGMFAGGLPGYDRHLALSGYQRPDIEQVLRQDPPPRESAVLVLLYRKRQELHTLLMLRPTYVGVHSAQVSFPGGKREPGDVDLRATALREFTEETGAPHDAFTVIDELSRVYIPPSRMLVTPVVAYAEELGPLVPDAREVAALIEVPLQELMRNDILKERSMFVQVIGREVMVPYWELQQQVVWGATAMMIAELRELLARLPG